MLWILTVSALPPTKYSSSLFSASSCFLSRSSPSTVPSQLSKKKAQISVAQYEEESLSNILHFFNTGQEMYKQTIHSMRKKNTELSFKRFQNTEAENSRACRYLSNAVISRSWVNYFVILSSCSHDNGLLHVDSWVNKRLMSRDNEIIYHKKATFVVWRSQDDFGELGK